MFVDADHVALLLALAGWSVYVPPSIIDPAEIPPFTQPPISEFAQGLFEAQQNLSQPLLAARAHYRSVFYQTRPLGWRSVALSPTELRLAQYLTTRQARDEARERNPAFRAKRIALGEAECAAVAIERGWTLWSDDNSIVELVRTLYPTCHVERLCGLVVRAVDERLIECDRAQHLYNEVFKRHLNLWSKLGLECEDDNAICR